MFLDEHQFVTTVMLPFLREHWHEIDVAGSPGAPGDKGDGRITKVELEAARDKAVEKASFEMANILTELIFRYDAICKAYGDGFERSQETEFGISQDDISVYAQLHAPDYRKAQGKPQPGDWMSDGSKKD